MGRNVSCRQKLCACIKFQLSPRGQTRGIPSYIPLGQRCVRIYVYSCTYIYIYLRIYIKEEVQGAAQRRPTTLDKSRLRCNVAHNPATAFILIYLYVYIHICIYIST